MFIVLTVVVVMVVRLKFSLQLHLFLMPSDLVSRWLLHLAMLIFLLFTGAVTRQMRVPALRAMNQHQIPKFVSLMGLVVVVVGYSTISIVYGVGVKPLFLLMCGSLVVLPTPAANYLWFCCGIRLIRSKLKKVKITTEVDNEQASLLLPSIPL